MLTTKNRVAERFDDNPSFPSAGTARTSVIPHRAPTCLSTDLFEEPGRAPSLQNTGSFDLPWRPAFFDDLPSWPGHLCNNILFLACICIFDDWQRVGLLAQRVDADRRLTWRCDGRTISPVGHPHPVKAEAAINLRLLHYPTGL